MHGRARLAAGPEGAAEPHPRPRPHDSSGDAEVSPLDRRAKSQGRLADFEDPRESGVGRPKGRETEMPIVL